MTMETQLPSPQKQQQRQQQRQQQDEPQHQTTSIPTTTTRTSLSQPLHHRSHLRRAGGTLALLNLPPRTSLSLNACPAQILREEEPLIVVHGITPVRGFHLLVVRTGGGGNEGDGGGGFLLHCSAVVLLYDGEEDWFVARTYDAGTEEISAEPALDDRSCDNLRRSVHDYTHAGNRNDGESGASSLNPTRILTYRAFTTDTDDDDTPRRQSDWSTHLTNHVSHAVLLRQNLHGDGDKLVPGTYRDDADEITAVATATPHPPEDGVTPSYPPVPCVDRDRKSFLGHGGTRRFLAGLSPADRTLLFLPADPRRDGSAGVGGKDDLAPSSLQDVVFRKVLDGEYGGRWEVLLGEWQLAFVLFVCLGCLSSLEHWRDTLAMLSLVTVSTVESHPQLYDDLLTCLSKQLIRFESGTLLDDLDYSRDNFLLPALQTLHKTCTEVTDQKYRKRLTSKSYRILRSVSPSDDGIATDPVATEPEAGEKARSENRPPHTTVLHDSDDDDSDGPVTVPYDEIEASASRSSHLRTPPPPRSPPPSPAATTPVETDPSVYRPSVPAAPSERDLYGTTYPLLFAAVAGCGGGEDVLMTCARVLDERRDVSLVREAAGYLEEVEAKR